MLNISVNEFRKKMGYYLKKIKSGETLVIGEKEDPIAKVAPIYKNIRGKRPAGLAKGDFVVPDDFDSPLPSEIINLFEKR